MIANSTRTPSIFASVRGSLSWWLRLILLLLELTETCQDCKNLENKVMSNKIYYK
jgi:hypothetical protein